MFQSSLQAAYKALLSRSRLLDNPGQAALVRRLSDLQDNLNSSMDPHRGVYIYGDVGTGKSRIADLFATTLPSAVSKRRIHFHEFMMDVHQRLHIARSQGNYSGDPLLQIGLDIRSESRVLCFDEFQVTDIADAMILKRLFGAIWQSGGVIVSTSNRHPDMLYANGLNRTLFLPFLVELQQKCEVWHMEGKEDYRISRRNLNSDDGVPVFFTDIRKFDQALELTLEKSFGKLHPVIIPVMMGRELNVLAARTEERHLIVNATFKYLCESFLGSADYYALCRKTDVLYLSGLRQFKAYELDFVRRFITLVDLAYESKTRIVCESTVPLLEVFANIVPSQVQVQRELRNKPERNLTVKGEGGSSSSMMSTFVGEMEWSATGLENASLASGGAGESDVRFAIGRAVSRLFEMSSKDYGVRD